MGEPNVNVRSTAVRVITEATGAKTRAHAAFPGSSQYKARIGNLILDAMTAEPMCQPRVNPSRDEPWQRHALCGER